MNPFLPILLSFCLISAPEQDSTVVLRYDLPIGNTYTYRVTTDQYVLPTSFIRLHSLMVIEIIGRDEEDNTICRLRLQSDTATSTYTNEIPVRAVEQLTFSGHRLHADVGFLDVTLNDRGELVDDTKAYDEKNRPSSISTQFERITEATMDQHVTQQRSGPFALQMVMPSIAGDNPLWLNRPYIDTVTTISRSVHLPTSYGPTGVAERVILFDTLIRTTTIDSLQKTGHRVRGFVTVESDRTSGLGTKYHSTSILQRDMRSGLIEALTETCYRQTAKGRKVAYVAKAVLIEESTSRSKANLQSR